MTTFNISIGALIICAGAVSACAVPVEDSQDEAEQVATSEEALDVQLWKGSYKQISGNAHTCRADAALWGGPAIGTFGYDYDSKWGGGYIATQARKFSGANAGACLAQARATCCAWAGPCISVLSPVSIANDPNSGATTAYCPSSHPIATDGEARAGIYGYGWTSNW